MKAIRIITLFMASAAVAAITSCAKEEASAPEQEQISIIKAEIVQPTDESTTKTSLGSLSGSTYPVLWTSSDAIAVSGKSATEYATYTTKDNTQSGTFTLSSGDAPEGEVYAYYPAGNVTGVSSATYTVTIPAEQNYVESSFGNGAFPMYATATTLEGGLTFHPLMSVLKLQLKSTDSKYVRRIVVTSDTENLSGTARIDMSSGAITWTSGSKSVELDCGESGVKLTSEAKTFHIAVPAGASKNYCVVITTTDAGKGVGKKLTGKTFTVGKIKKMPVVEVTASTASKPIYVEGSYMGDGIAITVSSTTTVWAPVNCGYDATHTYGLLYQWGRKVGGGYNSKEGKQTKTDASKSYDTDGYNKNPDDAKFYYQGSSPCDWYANAISKQLSAWPMKSGETGYVEGKIANPCPTGWRVPTYDQLNALTGNNGMESIGGNGWDSTKKGYWFNGSTSPKQNEGLFLPAAGYRYFSNGDVDDRGDLGYYWSSSVSGSYARYLYFDDGNANMNGYRRASGYSVRCVQE